VTGARVSRVYLAKLELKVRELAEDPEVLDALKRITLLRCNPR